MSADRRRPTTPGEVAAILAGTGKPVTSACHCLCNIAHPAQPGICDAEHVVTAATAWLGSWEVSVPLCGPCANARTPGGGDTGGRAQPV